MKKILMILMAGFFIAGFFISGSAFAVSFDTRASGSTVTFHTVANVVTFNSVTNYIYAYNNSTTKDCWMDLRCKDANGKRGYTTLESAVVRLPHKGSQTPNSVAFYFSTHNLGFITDKTANITDTVTYAVTGDHQNL